MILSLCVFGKTHVDNWTQKLSFYKQQQQLMQQQLLLQQQLPLTISQ